MSLCFAAAPSVAAQLRKTRAQPRWKCETHPPAGKPATGAMARRLATWLAADWDNKAQSLENPAFWAHIHVCFRPLPWHLLQAYALYCESAYDYNLGLPYKSSVIQIVHDGTGHLELASFKLTNPEEYFLGAHEPDLLQPLTADQLVPLPSACNTLYVWNETHQAFVGNSRPGKACRIRRGGKERETYLDSQLMLTKDQYAAWDLGKDPETDEIVWGTKAGPFVFECKQRLAHLVPEEPLLSAS